MILKESPLGPINDKIKQKVYKHHNWYLKEVKVIPVSGFNNIDCKYEVGLNKPWSLREFMSEQPNSSTTVPIDMNNGGYKVKGAKIMVLPKHFEMARQTFDEFRKPTKQSGRYDSDVDMVDDDATIVNSNIKGNADLLNQMFADENFPALETTSNQRLRHLVHLMTQVTQIVQRNGRRRDPSNLEQVRRGSLM